MQVHELVQWRQEWSFQLKCSRYVLDAAQVFFKVTHQYAVGGCHFSGPSDAPLCTLVRDPEFVAAVKELKPPPKLLCRLPQFCSTIMERRTLHTGQRRQSTLVGTPVPQLPDESRQQRACAKCGDRELRRPVTSSTMRTPARTYLLCSRRLWSLPAPDR